MLEFFYPTAIIFVPFIILFLIIPAFKYVKIIMIFIQLIFSFILASNNFIKKHSLYSGPRIQYIQSTDFFPIKSLNKTIDEDGIFQNISFDKMISNKFSIIKTKKYSVQCLEDCNYINIYTSSNSKLCGKDNLGNNLYFPENIECPINDIFISKYDDNFQNYTRLKLDNDNYLYYTNESKEGKLLIDFRISNDYEIPLNPEGDSESNFYSIPFYEDIDYNKDSYLYSIYYLGINSSSVTNNKLEKFVSKNHVYRNIYITKIVFFCYINLILLIVFLFVILETFCRECAAFLEKSNFIEIFFGTLLLLSLGLYLIKIILIIVCLVYQ